MSTARGRLAIVAGYGTKVDADLHRFLAAVSRNLGEASFVITTGGFTGRTGEPAEAEVTRDCLYLLGNFRPIFSLAEGRDTLEALRAARSFIKERLGPGSYEVELFCDRPRVIKTLVMGWWLFRGALVGVRGMPRQTSLLKFWAEILVATPLDLLAMLLPPLHWLKLNGRQGPAWVKQWFHV